MNLNLQLLILNLTKIIATIGPACADVNTFAHLIEAGVRVARLNFSHGSFDDFKRSLDVVRQASEQTNTPVGVLGDLCGPKIRVEQVDDPPLMLKQGDRLEFVQHHARAQFDAERNAFIIPSSYPNLVHEVQPGHRVLLDDGAIRSLAVQREGVASKARLVCHVTAGGPLTSRKGINLPDTALDIPALTDYDRQCAQWAIDHQLDYLALSFVQRARDVQQLADLLRSLQQPDQPRIPIIAKIEKPQALEDIHAITQASDGIMVARGDLGVEMDLAQVPVIQKKILNVAQSHGRAAVVATQMLQSMIESPTPTRAEVSDIATAIFDGADAVMLSGETAIGKYPGPAVAMMAHAAREAEQYQISQRTAVAQPPEQLQQSRYRTAALAHGVNVVVRDLRARYVLTWSERGGGAHYLSRNRLGVPIIAVSSSQGALRRMSLMFGVVPIHMDRPPSANAFVNNADEMLVKLGWADPGDPIVVAIGEPLGVPGVMNEIRVHYVAEVCRIDDRDTYGTTTRPR